MLTRYPVKQIQGDRRREWFEDDLLDLIVWYDDKGGVYGFQLCYDTQEMSEHALTWTKDSLTHHNAIDQGDETPTKNRSPIMVANGQYPKGLLLEEFTNRSDGVSVEIKNLVLDKIETYVCHNPDLTGKF